MHAFFNPAFTVLHDRVLDFLVGAWDWYRLLAVMGVNQHFRRVARDKLVRHFSQQALPLFKPNPNKPGSSFISSYMPSGAGFIRLRPCVYPHPELGDAVPLNDPRELFRPQLKEFQRFVAELAESAADLDKEEERQTAAEQRAEHSGSEEAESEDGQEEEEEQGEGEATSDDEIDPFDRGGTGKWMDFTITNFDPETQMCSLCFSGAGICIYYRLSVVPETGKERDNDSAVPAVFQFASTCWFRPALDGMNTHAGLQPAARPVLYPSRKPAMQPRVSQERGGRLEQRNFQCANGWFCDLTTQRLDKPQDASSTGGNDSSATTNEDLESPGCLLMVDELRVPLIDLLIPPTTLKDDIPGHDLLREYIVEENFDISDPEVQRLIAEMHEREGGLH